MAFIVKSNVTVSNLRVGQVPPSGIDIIPNGLLYYYDMKPGGSYRGNSNTLVDLSGNENNASLNHTFFTPNYVSDGEASYLDYSVTGSEDEENLGGMAVIPDTDKFEYLRGTDFEFTSTIWFNLNNFARNQSFSGLQDPNIRYYYNGYSMYYNWLQWDYKIYSQTQYLFHGNQSSQVPTTNHNYYNNGAPTNQWKNITLTYNSDGFKFYDDGALYQSFGRYTNYTLKWGYTRAANNTLSIAGRNIQFSVFGANPGVSGDISNSQGQFTSKINLCALYTRALSSDEVATNYDLISSRFS